MRRDSEYFGETLRNNVLSFLVGRLFYMTALFLLCVGLLSATETDSDETAPVTLASLITASRTLVAEAATGTSNATRFRIDATLFRESLRSFMLQQEQSGGEADAVPRNDLMNLVRMSALLQSAADCKTGRYIVCPPELMQQLRNQQGLLEQLLESPG